MTGPLLVGNNLAMLVAAIELAKRGRSLTLLADKRPLGGHFAGIEIEGHHFDIGMVMLEMHESSGGAADLRSYNPSLRNDWTRFGDIAGKWLGQQVELRRVPTPACLFERRVVPDFLISNRLDALDGAHVQPPNTLPKSDPRHPSNKNVASAYDHLSYGEAAALNHGVALHARYIEPFVRKLTGGSSADFLARYHRAVWVPLFYPETLERALRGQPTGLTEYPFWTTSEGFVGQLVRTLREQLASFPSVRVDAQPLISLQRDGGLWHAAVEGGEVHCGEQLALGFTTERAHALLQVATEAPGPAASVAVLFASVRADAIRSTQGCLMVLDEDQAAFRLTDQDALAGLDTEHHRVTIEAAPGRLAVKYPGLDAADALRQELALLMGTTADDAVRVLKCISAQNAVPLPTADAVARLDASRAALAEAAPAAMLTGNLLGYGVASLNDQLIQGLVVAEEFS